MSFRLLIISAFAVSLLLSIGVSQLVLPETVVLPELGAVEPFALQDSTGQRFQSDSLEGSVWIANFFFTSCRGICPTIMGEMDRVQREFAKNPSVQFVSITVDPETDTVDLLAEYKSNFAAANERWHFLTGTTKDVRSVSESAFRLAAGERPSAHSRRVVLLDSRGVIRGYYDGMETNIAQKIIRDTVALVAHRGE